MQLRDLIQLKNFKRLIAAGVILVVLVGVAAGLTLYGSSNAPDESDPALAEPAEKTPEELAEEQAQAEWEALQAAKEEEDAQAEPLIPATLATPKEMGALHVKGSMLVNEEEVPVQLRGISTHGVAWYPDYVNQKLFTELRKDWGANVVRLALYAAEEGGYATDAIRADLDQIILKGVEYATKADMYVVVDWHTLTDADPRENQWAAEEFFKLITATLGDRDNVIYEICNEPNGETSWSDIKEYANAIIPLIRANDPDAVIIVGTPNFSQDVDVVMDDRLEDPNVMYALHFYAGTHQAKLRNKLVHAVEEGLPVFVSEFGICEASGKGKIDYRSADKWIKLMNDLDVSYICWNLSNKNERAALIDKNVDKTHGFTLEDLSDQGIWLLKQLNATGFDAEELHRLTADTKPNASGSEMLLGTEDSIQWTAVVKDAVAGEGDRIFYRYELTGNNFGAARKSWSLTFEFNEDIKVTDAKKCTYAVEGNKITVTNAKDSESVAAGASITGVQLVIEGTQDLAVIS